MPGAEEMDENTHLICNTCFETEVGKSILAAWDHADETAH